MRIYAVTPIHVDPAELARRQARYDAMAPRGLSVDLVDLGPDAPRALESAADVRASDTLMQEALRHAPPGYDALLPDCVLDPGVSVSTAGLTAPVRGILRLSLGWNLLCDRACAVVVRNDAIADELRERVRAYGWADDVLGVVALDITADETSNDQLWADALGRASERLAAMGVTDIIQGCTAVQAHPSSGSTGVRVVDPTSLALRLLAAESAVEVSSPGDRGSSAAGSESRDGVSR